jgi:tetratricopeptide (TPR) repeat protein
MTRDELLAELRERITRFVHEGDADMVLSDHASHLADQLLDATSDPLSDLEVLLTLGWLHWHGYLASPEGQGQDHLTAALKFLEPVYRLSPVAVPATVRDYFGVAVGVRLVLEEAISTGNSVALDAAIDLLERALGQALSTGSLLALDAAIGLLERALEATPSGHARRPEELFLLGANLSDRFERTGVIEDLDRGIDLIQEAVDATTFGHPHRVHFLTGLSGALSDRFQHTGTPEDLDRAISASEEAANLTSLDNPESAVILAGLGIALSNRFAFSGTLADIDRAIEIMREALQAVPQGHFARPPTLHNLGIVLLRRFDRTGMQQDLDQAIAFSREAVDSASAGHTNLAEYLPNLGVALLRRFERTGSLEDLNQAVNVIRQAVDSIPDGHPRRVVSLDNLGVVLRRRFERTGMLEDLVQAIAVAQEAVDSAGEGHPDRARFLSNLGVAWLRRFERTGMLEDLDRAIEAGRGAVDASRYDHPERVAYLSSLGISLDARFERTGMPGDRDQAIAVAQEAVDSTGEGHPDRAGYLFNVGSALLSRFEQTRVEGDMDRALAAFKEAAGEESGPVDIRAYAAREWGRSAVTAEKWVEAVEGFGKAVRFAGLVAARGLERTDQEFRLGQLAGLGAEAAAACIQAGQWGRAVELFEQGRGVLFSQVLDARSDLTDLREAHSHLAAEFTRWLGELDRPAPLSQGMLADEVDTEMVTRVEVDRRREAATEFERVLSQIQALPGFERFLAPRPVEELLAAAAGGPVVLINIASLRSDALILTLDGIDVLPLDGVDPNGVREQVNTLLSALTEVDDPARSAAARIGAEASLNGVLCWLWDKITGPVLDHLGYVTGPPEDAVWPRVWWCPSGPLSLLPLHASGCHDLSAERPDAVIDRVISSAIPTIRALLHARRVPSPGPDTRILAVTMPQTAGQADLPGAAQEAGTLQHLLAGRVDVLGLAGFSPATYDTVTAALPSHAWVHFACHGQNNLTDPSASHLLLADYQARPLTVVDLTRARLQGVDLAFLSACTTARVSAALPDEPIHLAAACQLAGYRHVIATLWPISDADTAWLTKAFYTIVTYTSTSNAATALHQATRQLRSTNRRNPSYWAPYTHTGP